MSGDAGQDAILGDRGGVVNQYLNAGDARPGSRVSIDSSPAETYTGLPAGRLRPAGRPAARHRRRPLDRRVHRRRRCRTTASPTGGDDRIRGGPGDDNIHAGFGDDLANGDSGGDQVFGDDGADVLWGGKGCDPVARRRDAGLPDRRRRSTLDRPRRQRPLRRPRLRRRRRHARGVDAGRRSAPTCWTSGRAAPTPPAHCADRCLADDSGGGDDCDPCCWFEMTDTDDADPAADNQHHQGTDWIYGGWDRDVMQGDVAQQRTEPR